MATINFLPPLPLPSPAVTPLSTSSKLPAARRKTKPQTEAGRMIDNRGKEKKVNKPMVEPRDISMEGVDPARYKYGIEINTSCLFIFLYLIVTETAYFIIFAQSY